MNFIKKLSGSFLLGLTVIGLAFSASAFTKSSKEAAKKFAGEIYVNTTVGGDYQEIPSSMYDDTNCQQNSPYTCSWKRTAVPGTVPQQFNAQQIDSLLQEGLIEANSTKNGIYPL